MKTLTLEQLKTALEVLDALHTKAAGECQIRTAQAHSTAMWAVQKEIAKLEEPKP